MGLLLSCIPVLGHSIYPWQAWSLRGDFCLAMGAEAVLAYEKRAIFQEGLVSYTKFDTLYKHVF